MNLTARSSVPTALAEAHGHSVSDPLIEKSVGSLFSDSNSDNTLRIYTLCSRNKKGLVECVGKAYACDEGRFHAGKVNYRSALSRAPQGPGHGLSWTPVWESPTFDGSCGLSNVHSGLNVHVHYCNETAPYQSMQPAPTPSYR